MKRRVEMLLRCAALSLLLLVPTYATAQLSQTKTDPLSKIQVPQGAPACSATEVSSCAEAASKILPQVLSDSPMADNLRRLTDEVGGRVTGSPQMTKAVEWAKGAFRAAGVEVHTEKYKLPVSWSEGETRLELLGPAQFPVRLVSTGWSPATQTGGIEASIVDIGAGGEEEFARAGDIKGKILLAHSEIGTSWADLFDEYLRPPGIIARALKGNASAILWMGARERFLMYRHTNSLLGQADKIPQAI